MDRHFFQASPPISPVSGAVPELTESVKKEVNRYFGGSLRVQDWDELVQEGYLEEIFVNPDTRSRVGAGAARRGEGMLASPSVGKCYPDQGDAEEGHTWNYRCTSPAFSSGRVDDCNAAPDDSRMINRG